jgi:hypothetical protein
MEDAPPLAPPVDPEPEVPTFPPRKALREFQSLLDELTITAVRMKAILDREEADDVLDEEMDRLTAQADGLRTQLAAALPGGPFCPKRQRSSGLQHAQMLRQFACCFVNGLALSCLLLGAV